MAYTVILHIAGEEPILAEMEELPNPSDNAVVFTNPRRRDGKPVPTFDREAVTFYFPWYRINYLEVLAPRRAREEIVEFFRED